MKVERFAVRACCGTTSVAFKLGTVISMDFLPLLIGKGFTESRSFTKAGILYVENEVLIATGAFNSNILQIKCKKQDCNSSINIIEELLTKME